MSVFYESSLASKKDVVLWKEGTGLYEAVLVVIQ